MKKLLFLWFCLSAPVMAAQEGASTTILNAERALPILVSRGASSETQEAAGLLAEGLQKISGRKFAVVNAGEGDVFGAGIRIGTDHEIPGILPNGEASRVASQMREDYLLRSNGEELLILAREGVGLKSAVWDFLYRLGYRQYFPGAKWEIWPSKSEIAVALNEFQSPAYYNRTFAPAGMNWPEAMASFRDWTVKNRMVSQFQLNTTHIYGAIIDQYPEHFREYPEDVVPNDHPEAVKLDPSRQTVLKIAAEFAIARKTKNPELDSISMDPSDGGGWRGDSPLGSPSNQAVTLANYVAGALQGPFPGMKVGILAYHEHSPPPEIPVDRNVIVSVAAGFVKGGYTFEELLRQWGRGGNETGVYEYLSVSLWDFCQPGKSRASNLSYLQRTIPQYYTWGSRYYRSEISNSWAPHGLGYYLASRMLWDTGAAADIGALLEDFYRRSFGAAAPKMQHYFERYLLAEGTPLLSRDLVGRMYRTLDEALATEITQEERSRIVDFVEYTRFLELSLDCYEAPDASFGESYRLLCEYLWRTRASCMVNGGNYFWKSNNPVHSSSTIFGRRVERPAKWSDPKHPWKRGEAMTQEELLVMLKEGIARNPLLDIEPVAYSTSLVPLPQGEEGNSSSTNQVVLWRDNRFYLELPEETGKAYFSVRPRSQTHGPVKLRLFSKEHALVDEPVWSIEIPPDGKEHHIIVTSPYRGVHELEYSDGAGHAVLTWPKGQRVVFPLGATQNITIANTVDLAFYVPKGTKRVGLYVEKPTGKIVSVEGEAIFDFSTLSSPGYLAIPVSENRDGAVWVMKASSGRRILLNVPPYVSRHPSELMVSEEALGGE